MAGEDAVNHSVCERESPSHGALDECMGRIGTIEWDHTIPIQNYEPNCNQRWGKEIYAHKKCYEIV